MVAALTVDQEEYIRANAGDACTTELISDTLLEKLWQRTDGDECKTIVLALRILEGKARTKINLTDANGSSSNNQIYQSTRELRIDWEKRCGMSGGTLSLGVMDLAIDQEADT